MTNSIRAWIESHEDGFFDEGDRAELVRIVTTQSAESAHKEALLGQVWDFGRDNNLSYKARITGIMAAIRERPDAVSARQEKDNV